MVWGEQGSNKKRQTKQLDRILQDEAILYLHPNKKETATWFQALGRSTPVGGTKFGLIQTIAQAQEKNKRFRADEGIPKEMGSRQYSFNDTKGENEKAKIKRLPVSMVSTPQKSGAAMTENLFGNSIAQTRNQSNLSDKTSQHSLDLLTEVNEGIAAEQKRKAAKVAETMDYGNPRAMKRRAGEESYVQPESDTKTAVASVTCHPLARRTPPLTQRQRHPRTYYPCKRKCHR